MIKILIVEDEKPISELIRMNLDEAGYQCECVYDGLAAADILERNVFDLILLDVMLPKMDGLEMCRKIREKHNVPIIMVSAKTQELDKIVGLTTGADDYVTKPYNPTIVLLRIESFLRRSEQTGSQSEQRASSVRGEKAEGEAVQEELQDEELRLNLLRSTVSYHGDEVVLSKNELAILHCLMSRKGQIVSRDELMDHLWDMSEFVDDKHLLL